MNYIKGIQSNNDNFLVTKGIPNNVIERVPIGICRSSKIYY